MELSKRWQDRRTERWFSDADVEEEKIKKLCDVIPHCLLYTSDAADEV